MARYAAGKYAYGMCDRSGRKVLYKDLRTEWTGMRVHYSEFETRHPQDTPNPKVDDVQTLRNPRPDNDSTNEGDVDGQLRDSITMTHGDT